MNATEQKKRTLQNELPINDELFLSPIQKYKIYGKFPWKLVIHFLLMICTSFQVLLQINTTNAYSRSQERKFYDSFIEKSDKTDFDWLRRKYLLSITDLLDHVKLSINNYYSMTKNSLEDIRFYPEEDTPPDIHMEVSYIKSLKDRPNLKSIFIVTDEDIGPLELEDKRPNKTFFSHIESFHLNYTFIINVPMYFGDYYSCFIWLVSQQYSFNHRAHVVISLDINRQTCSNSNNTFYSTFIAEYAWLHLCVLALSTMSLVLLVKYFYNMFKLYWRVKTKLKYSLTESQLESMGFHEKEQNGDEIQKIRQNYDRSLQKKEKKNPFLNLWTVLTLVGNIIQIAGSALSIFDKNNNMFFNDLLIGLSCVFGLLSIGRYLQNLKHYSIIFNAIQLALPTALRYLIGVIPLFLGFTQFSICVFWRSERFISTSKAIGSLYAIFNGDAMYDIIVDLKRTSYLFGQIFAYVFCLFFIMVVMNVFLSIIGEAYVRGKMANHNHWIYSYIKLDKEKEQKRKSVLEEKENESPFVSDFKLIELNELNQEQENDMNELKERMKSMQKNLDEQIKISEKVYEQLKEKDFEKYMHKQLAKIREDFEELRDNESI